MQRAIQRRLIFPKQPRRDPCCWFLVPLERSRLRIPCTTELRRPKKIITIAAADSSSAICRLRIPICIGVSPDIDIVCLQESPQLGVIGPRYEVHDPSLRRSPPVPRFRLRGRNGGLLGGAAQASALRADHLRRRRWLLLGWSRSSALSCVSRFSAS